jgi:hypothetical protein
MSGLRPRFSRQSLEVFHNGERRVAVPIFSEAWPDSLGIAADDRPNKPESSASISRWPHHDSAETPLDTILSSESTYSNPSKIRPARFVFWLSAVTTDK